MHDIYQHIKAVIDKWDPVELLAMHAPSDEYDYEIRLICEFLTVQPLISERLLLKQIYTIFTENFGSDVFLKNENDCKMWRMRLL